MEEMKVCNLLETYMSEYAESQIVSVARTRSAVKALNQQFGQIDHARLSAAMLRNYRRDEELAPASVNREFAVLSAALKYALNEGLIRKIPDIKKRPGAGRRVQWLSPGEIKTLLAEAARHQGVFDFAFVTLMTGQRLQAVLGLRWEQVDLGGQERNNVIWFTDRTLLHAHRRKGRGSVPINPQLVPVLERLKAESKSPYVLVNRYGVRYQDINRKHWREVVAAAGMSWLTPHHLRHTVASQLIEAQVPLIEVSKLLGHKNTRVTEAIYVHTQPQLLTTAVTRLGELAS